MGRKCLTEITPKQLQFSPTLTGKHNLIGKIPVHNVFPYLAQSHILVTINDGTYKRPKSEL